MQKESIFQDIEEQWRNVPGYEGHYAVSDMGRVFSLVTDKFLKQPLKRGYFSVAFVRKGKAKYFRTHRIVAIAFIPNPENKPQVNHIDGNKLNNTVSNLEWVTPTENTVDAYAKGLAKSGSDSANAKPIIQFDLQGNEIARYGSAIEAAKAIGAKNHGMIGVAARGFKGRITAYGFLWAYVKDNKKPAFRKQKTTAKKIYQFTLQGELVATFDRVTDAGKSLGINPAAISRQMARNRPCMGFIFSFEPKTYVLKENKQRTQIKPVDQFDSNGVFIKRFRSMWDAERETKVSQSKISMVCANLRPKAGGFIWRHAKLQAI